MPLLGTEPPHSGTWEAPNALRNWKKPTGVGGWAKLKTILVFRAHVDGDHFVVSLHGMVVVLLSVMYRDQQNNVHFTILFKTPKFIFRTSDLAPERGLKTSPLPCVVRLGDSRSQTVVVTSRRTN